MYIYIYITAVPKDNPYTYIHIDTNDRRDSLDGTT